MDATHPPRQLLSMPHALGHSYDTACSRQLILISNKTDLGYHLL